MLKKFQDFIACQTSDERYLHTLKLIYQTWQPAHCFIAKFVDNETKAKTVCYLENGVHVANLAYELADTPCDQVKQEDDAASVEADWKFAAMVIDRLCLIVYTLFTIIASVTVIWTAPHVIVT